MRIGFAYQQVGAYRRAARAKISRVDEDGIKLGLNQTIDQQRPCHACTHNRHLTAHIAIQRGQFDRERIFTLEPDRTTRMQVHDRPVYRNPESLTPALNALSGRKTFFDRLALGTMSNMKLKIEIEQETDGRWLAEVPDLPGTMVYGDSREQAIANAEALAFRVLAERLENGETVIPRIR
jgi:predicted RNase H-like HicB family nuclease